MGMEAGTAMLISSLIAAGATAFAATQEEDTPEAPKAPQIDKMEVQSKKVLDELEEADTGLTKRKKQTSKDKFKVNIPDAETGVTTEKGVVQGVQI